MKVSETLNRAADLIEERGWTQGVSGFYGPRLCALGALGAAFGKVMTGEDRRATYSHPVSAALASYLGVEWDPDRLGGHPIYYWNDAPERTAGEVIETLRACAVIEEAREQQDAAFETYKENVEAAR